MKDCKNILYIGADINAQSSLRKLRKFTTIATSKGYRVAAVWPGFSWQSTEDKWRINFFQVFQKHDACAVVFDGEFMKEIEAAEELCTLFNEKGIPVIALDVELPGAVSVRFDEEAAVEELVRHVMSVHKRRNLLFFGDSCQAVSSNRAADAFIRSLKEAGIEDAENRVSYAPFRYGYGVAPVVAKLAVFQPDAVICSDNNIANVAVAILQNMGKSVPDDVIVTGLNGVSKYKSGIPNLTTARRNITLQAQHCFSVIEHILKADSEETSNVIMPEEMVYSESCGCNTYEMIADTDELIRSLIVQREWACMQERRQGRLYERVMQSSTVEERKEIFRDCLPEMTYLCLRKDFLDNPTTNIGELSPGGDFVVFAASDPNMEGKMFNSEEFDQRLEKQLRNAAPLIMYPVFAKRQYFGFVVSEAPGFVELQMMMGRFLVEMCRSLSILVSREELKIRSEELEDMNEYLNNVKYIDSITGLLNHNGLIMELENCKAECISSRKTIYTICVDLDHLGNINDVYGHSEGDYAIMQLSRIIKESSSPTNLLAHIGSDEFIVVLREDESSKDEVEYFINRVKNKVASFNKESDKEYTLNVNVSTSITVPYEDTDLGKILDEALLNKRLVKNNRKASNSESVEMTPEELKQVEVIKDVIDNNRFRYAFQPIVNANTGDIFGYEALMRTDLEHSISPLTIIKYSTANERLYDIERATFFNILDTVSANRDKVEGKKIFINSIPGYQLDAADFDQLRKKYSDILKEVFIEVTEQSEQNDEEVRVLTERSVKDGFGIAIDDYGVGYANTTSLLRYTPNCIKIDRLLIQNLQNDPRKQHFVKNIIEFAHNNNCYALAEGVETSGELKASINLGVNLIQGFYTAKPSFEIVDHIEELIQKEILECNASPAEKRFSKLYVVSKEKELMLTRIGLEMYTDILISGQEVVLSGNLDYPAQVKIRIKDNTDSTLTIRNTILDNEKDEVGIEIGENATLTLIVEGDNYINSNGIRVPASSTLKLQGNGNLSIKTKCQEAFGIGNDLQHPFGTILSDISGNLSIDLNGEKAVGIGGCVPGQGAKIMLKGGDNSIKASSTAFVGIGAFSGPVNVLLTEMHMAINYNVINGVGIGSPSGTSNIRVSNLLLEIKAGGKSVTGIGGGPGTQNNVEIASAEVILNMNAPRVIMVGCAMGHSKIYAEHTRLELHGSGGHIMGMGSADMGSEIVLKSVGVAIKISSDDPMPIGAKPENCDFGASEPEIEIINYSAEGGEH